MTVLTPPPQTVKILLVEDDIVDVMGIKRALKELRITNPLVHAKDGLEALDILHGRHEAAKVSDEFIIILDLNMPRMGGVEFLEELRADPRLKSSIVFVLTTSSADEDKVAAYCHNIAGYIVKADAKKTFIDALKMLDFYWSVVALPRI